MKPKREHIREAGHRGSARSSFVQVCRELLRDYREGRGASACMQDLGVAMQNLDKRSPRAQGREPQR